MTVNYDDYAKARNAMKSMIDNKREMVDELESEIHHLRKSMRVLDTEFKEKIDNKDLPDDYS